MSSELRAVWGMRIVLFVFIAGLGGVSIALSLASDESLLAVLAAVGAIALIALVQFFMSGMRLRVHQHGIERQGRFGTKRIAWNNLKSYQLQLVDMTAIAGASGGLVGVLVVKGIQRAFKKELVPNTVVLLAKDGTKVTFGGNLVGYKELLRTLIPFLTEQLFAVAKPSFDAGAELQFGKKLTLQREVGITFNGVFGKKQVLPLTKVASATLDRAALVIRRNDTNAVWQSVPANLVLDLGVFQKFVELAAKPYDEGLPMAWTN